jgi:hypothetical protein
MVTQSYIISNTSRTQKNEVDFSTGKVDEEKWKNAVFWVFDAPSNKLFEVTNTVFPSNSHNLGKN